MKGKTGIFVPRIAVAVLALLFSLSSVTYAAPATTQKSTQQVTPATGAASSLLNPNAPPQGSITITTPQSGATWYTGCIIPYDGHVTAHAPTRSL